MFTKNNRQLQSTDKTGINNDRNKNIRIANFSLKGLYTRSRAFLFVALVAFTFLTMSANSAQAQAQQNNYWANDGCYYWHKGSQWERICPADQSRTKYYYDVEANRQWHRTYYVDTSVYSEGGSTFKQIYVYAWKTWTRAYSNGGQYAYHGNSRTWMELGVYRDYENMKGRQANPVDNLLWQHQKRLTDIWLAPACLNSSHGCHH